MKALHLRIRGRVQGVGFRESMRSEAVRLGVGGWVRNCADGSVEALICGEAARISTMLDWCLVGPPLARVEALERAEKDAPCSPFEIRP